MLKIEPRGKQKKVRPRWLARLRRAVSLKQLRTALALGLLFTSTLQSFVAQAHIHVPSRQAPDGTFVTVDASTQPSTAPDESDDRSKRTRGDGSSTCPLCQALAFSGAALAHSFSSSLAQVRASSIVAIDQIALPFIAAVSYSWTGRGPPLD